MCGSLKSIEQFKKSSATCKFRQGAKSKLECGLANTVVFGKMIQHGVGIALLTLHFRLYGGLVGMYVFDLIYPFQILTDD